MGTLRASVIFNNAKLLLIVVESVDCQHNKWNSGCYLYGNIEPIALIVCTQDKTYALDMQSNPASIDILKQDIPELSEIMTSFNDA